MRCQESPLSKLVSNRHTPSRTSLRYPADAHHFVSRHALERPARRRRPGELAIGKISPATTSAAHSPADHLLRAHRIQEVHGVDLQDVVVGLEWPLLPDPQRFHLSIRIEHECRVGPARELVLSLDRDRALAQWERVDEIGEIIADEEPRGVSPVVVGGRDDRAPASRRLTVAEELCDGI